MNVIVFAAASREGGALMIYRQFLEHLPAHIGQNRYYVFMTEGMPIPEIPGVTYFPVDVWQSMRRRIRFDSAGCRCFLEEKGIRADKVISFQNTGVNALKGVPQLVYYHQAIPFYPYRWNPLKAAERRMFLYKRIYPFFVRTSIGKHTQVVVQTPFVKQCFVRFFHFDARRVHVFFPDVRAIDRTKVSPFPFEDGATHFIYPAYAYDFKNHRLLAEALQCLGQRDLEVLAGIRLHLTLTVDDSPELASFVRGCGLDGNVIFDGPSPFETLLQKYAACKGLLFPSKMETIGLPLLEAASLGLPVLAADLGYARDVLDGYAGAEFLSLEDPALWADRIASLAAAPLRRHPYDAERMSSWPEFFRIVDEM